MMKRLKRSPFLVGVLTLASGTAFAQALPVLATPVVSRLFTPDDFGVFGLFTAFISMTAPIAGLSFPLAIVSNRPKREAAQLAILGMMVTVPVAFIVTFALYLLQRNSWLGYQELPSFAMVFAWYVLVVIGIYNSLRYWQVREGAYRLITKATLSQSIGRTVTQIVTGGLSLGGGGLMVSEVVRRTAGVSQLTRASWKSIRDSSSNTSLNEYWQVAKEYKKFPLFSTPSSLINSVAMSLPVPLLVSAYGIAESGQFSMAYRVLALPVTIIGAAVADVFHSRIAQIASQNLDEVRREFLRVAGVLFVVGLIPSLVIMVWGQDIFEMVLGSQWGQAGAFATGIMPWVLMSFVVSPLSRLVLVFRGQELKFIYDFASFIGVVGGITFGSHQGWSVEQTVALLGVSQAVAYLVYFAMLWRVIPQPSQGQLP